MANAAGGDGIVRIISGDCVEHDGGVPDIAGDRTCRILGMGVRNDAGAADQASRRPQTDERRYRRGAANGIDGVGPESRSCEVAGHSDRRAAARPERVAGKIIRVMRLPPDRAAARRNEGKLAQIRLGENNCSRSPKLAGDKTIFRRDRILQGEGAAGRSNIGGVHVVFENHRDSVQGSLRLIVLAFARRDAWLRSRRFD